MTFTKLWNTCNKQPIIRLCYDNVQRVSGSYSVTKLKKNISFICLLSILKISLPKDWFRVIVVTSYESAQRDLA
jgi:hypothetical protein